jgi:hypothetical protein
MHRLASIACLSLAVALAAGCSGTSNEPTGSGGRAAGGAVGSGGVATGGSNGVGGNTAGQTGGAPATGGRAGSGGASASGGAQGTGGVATGGVQATGGKAGTGGVGAGGTVSTGGEVANGGSQTSGGRSGAGGASTSGGAVGSGGMSAGGAMGSGGVGRGGSTGAGGGAAGGSTGSKFHVFLLLGQSNMAGYPKAQAADKVKNDRIKVLGFDDCSATGRKADQWDVAVPPLHECWNGALGPGDYFAKTLIDKIPANDTIGLVPCALSGQAIEVMMKSGGSKYTWILNRAKAAQQIGGVIEGILFHQGESNCGNSGWPDKVKTFITDLRTDLGIGDVPFLAGELAPTGACSQHNTLVNKLPTIMTKAYVVSAQGLVLDPADTTYHLHFDHDSQVTFGKRYEATMVQALGW